MPKTKEQKANIIQDLTDKIKNQKTSVLIDYSAVESKSLFALREELKKNNGAFVVAKKTLLIKALEKAGLKELADKIGQLKIQLAVAFGFEDEVAPAKLSYDYAKKNENIKIVGGFYAQEYLEKEKVESLALLPSKQELLAKFLFTVKSPVANLVYTLNGNLSSLVVALKAIGEKKQ